MAVRDYDEDPGGLGGREGCGDGQKPGGPARAAGVGQDLPGPWEQAATDGGINRDGYGAA